MRNIDYKLENQDASGDVTTEAMIMLENTGAAVQVVWTGTPTGTITFEGSNDGQNFVDIGATGYDNPAGSASNILVNLNKVFFKHLRAKYTASSGSGEISFYIFVKGY